MWPLFGRFDFDLYGYTAYAYALAVLLLVVLAARRLVHSPFGLSLRAIRENSAACPQSARRAAPGCTLSIQSPLRSPVSPEGCLRDHAVRLARGAQFRAVCGTGHHPGDWRDRTSLWRRHRRHCLPGGARPALRHEPAVLVFLDRADADRRGAVPAERRPGRLAKATAKFVPSADPRLMTVPALRTTGLHKSFGSLVVAQDVDDISAARRPLRADRPERRRKDHADQSDHRNAAAGLRAKIILGEEEITALEPPSPRQAGLTRTFQINTLFPDLEPLEAVALAICERHGVAGIWWRRLTAIPRGGGRGLRDPGIARLGHVCYRTTRELAYGQQRLLEIALALATKPKVLLLDEPAPACRARKATNCSRRSPTCRPTSRCCSSSTTWRWCSGSPAGSSSWWADDFSLEGTPAEIAADPRVREVYLGRSRHA